MKNVKSVVVFALILGGVFSAFAAEVLPSSIKMKGDLFLRYHHDTFDQSTSEDRDRFRLRYRLGFEGEASEYVKVKAGIASGSGDPRSRMITFQDSSNGKAVNLDYACATYEAYEGLEIVLGKAQGGMPFWRTTPLLFDGDINPEGINVKMIIKDDAYEVFGTVLASVLDEYADNTNDPYMMAVQAGGKINFDPFCLKMAATYYSIKDEVGTAFDYTAGTNTLADKKLVYEYDTPVLSIEFSGKDLFVPYLAVFGDYVNNPDPSDDNIGWATGIKFGNEKIKEQNDWQVFFFYRYLEKDAWLDILPDADYLVGKTGTEGYKLGLTLGVSENMYVGANYLFTEYIDGPATEETIYQLDANYKFA